MLLLVVATMLAPLQLRVSASVKGSPVRWSSSRRWSWRAALSAEMGVSPRPHSSRVQSLRCGCHTIERDTSESPYSSRRFFVEFGSQSAKWSSCEIRKPWCGSRCFWYSSRPAKSSSRKPALSFHPTPSIRSLFFFPSGFQPRCFMAWLFQDHWGLSSLSHSGSLAGGWPLGQWSTPARSHLCLVPYSFSFQLSTFTPFISRLIWRQSFWLVPEKGVASNTSRVSLKPLTSGRPSISSSDSLWRQGGRSSAGFSAECSHLT
mmetsp:Transcript_34765/g.81857  ORF Transcript_34765/g.81857 Transcript_34765/m.81857 type:complete len:261 (+) Transcript_34765:232-1014(+)